MMNSKEALKRLKQETAPATYMPDFDKDECIEIIKKDLDKLEQREKEYQELKEKNLKLSIENHNSKIVEEMNKTVVENKNKQLLEATELNIKYIDKIIMLKKAIKILKGFVSITKGRNEETLKWDIPVIYSLGLNKKISQEQYELLNQVFESVGGDDD